ncbi:MAG TPA: hypothetical protein VFO18_06920 [Methylomirabilota bacterium]|nr:hypothetical protein [Methylomirabilota bacterium]
MNTGWCRVISATAGLVLSVAAAPAQAVEYRLEVASLFESGFVSFLKGPSELRDGASGPGLDALEAALDQGAVPRGPLLSDRHALPVKESVARAYGAVAVRAEVKTGGEGKGAWDEVRWDGKPGERTVWLVAPEGRGRPQELYRVALKGTGPFQHFTPYTVTGGGRLRAVKYGLNFLWFHEERGDMWSAHLARTLDLGGGIGAAVGENFNATFPDQVYLIVDQPPQPMTFKAVLVWRERQTELETPRFPRRVPR